MWFGLIAGWIIASAVLYFYLAVTAREPSRPECMDCRLSDCAGCPLLSERSRELDVRRAA
ncbi:MAG: hypothetical protein N3B12_01990 [Armatimonadetes bacterium]|nr:hypothetical protein [Armatimonadota bacterium]